MLPRGNYLNKNSYQYTLILLTMNVANCAQVHGILGDIFQVVITCAWSNFKNDIKLRN